jgi:hypothetical protein
MALLDMNGFKRINDIGGTPPAIARCSTSRTIWDVRCGRPTCVRATAATSFSSSCPAAVERTRSEKSHECRQDIAAAGTEAQFPAHLSVSAGVAVFP